MMNPHFIHRPRSSHKGFSLLPLIGLMLFLIQPFHISAQRYVVKFFAYPANAEVAINTGKGGIIRSPHTQLHILFEKRSVYEGFYAYSPDRVFGHYPGLHECSPGFRFLVEPFLAHSFSISEETYEDLKPDSTCIFFASLTDCMLFGNEIMYALKKNAPDLSKEAFTPVSYVQELIRLNTPNYQPFTDERDGRIYNSVKIGQQIWMAENLNYKPDSVLTFHPIPETYGRLYDWSNAMKACPEGWHLSTKAEWDSLIVAAGGPERAALNLKASDFWLYPQNNPEYISTDSLGFRILPASEHSFRYKNENTGFWTSSELRPGWVWMVWLDYYHKEVLFNTTIYGDNLHLRKSVRCVKNSPE